MRKLWWSQWSSGAPTSTFPWLFSQCKQGITPNCIQLPNFMKQSADEAVDLAFADQAKYLWYNFEHLISCDGLTNMSPGSPGGYAIGATGGSSFHCIVDLKPFSFLAPFTIPKAPKAQTIRVDVSDQAWCSATLGRTMQQNSGFFFSCWYTGFWTSQWLIRSDHHTHTGPLIVLFFCGQSTGITLLGHMGYVLNMGD